MGLARAGAEDAEKEHNGEEKEEEEEDVSLGSCHGNGFPATGQPAENERLLAIHLLLLTMGHSSSRDL